MGGGGVGGGAGAVGGSYVNGGRLVVAIIGAGISGLSAASRIAEIATRRSLPISTIVLDKGRSVGGRCATRRTTTYPLAFWDTGAQFFTASDPRMRPLLTSLESSDLIGVWSYSGAGLSPPEHAGPARPHYAFRRSGMNQLPIFMAERLLAATAAHREHAHGNGASSCSLHVNAEVLSIAANPRSHDAKKPWRVQWKNALEPAGLAAATEAAPSLPSADFVDADVVVLTSPVPQSLALLKRGSVRLSEESNAALSSISYDPCLALLLSFADAPNTAHPAAAADFPALGAFRPADSPAVALVASSEARLSTLGGSTSSSSSASPSATRTVLVHATAAWSAAHHDRVANGGSAAADAAALELLAETRRALRQWRREHQREHAGAQQQNQQQLPFWERDPAETQLKRWRYGRVAAAASAGAACTPGAGACHVAEDAAGGGGRVVFAGDAFARGGDVEGAFGSGWDAAEACLMGL